MMEEEFKSETEIESKAESEATSVTGSATESEPAAGGEPILEGGSLSDKTVFGVFWKFAERIGAQLVSLVVSFVLLIILGPAKYGIVALASIFITICNVFVSNGLGTALVHAKEADDVDFSSVFYANITLSAILYVIIFFTAPLIADFYGNPLISSVMRVMGIRIPIAAINSIQQAYVARKMQFRKFFFATLIGTVISCGVGIALAVTGFGVWALVAQYLTNVTIDTIVLFIAVKWYPKKCFSLKRLKTLVSYGWKILVSGLIDTGYNQLRSLVIGKKYDESQLSYYEQGQKFPSFIADNLSTSVDSVLLSSMSKVQDSKERVKFATKKAIKLSSYILIPCMVGLACVAESFVSLLPGWEPMRPYLQIMCFVYAFYPIHTSNLNAMKAVGRSDLFLVLEIIKKAVGIAALFATIWCGSVIWIAIGVAISAILSAIINIFPNRKLINFGYIEQLKALLPALLLSVIMGVPVYFMNYIPINKIVLLVLQIVTGITIYIVGSILFKAESFYYICGKLKQLLVKRRAAQPIEQSEKSNKMIKNELQGVTIDSEAEVSEKDTTKDRVADEIISEGNASKASELADLSKIDDDDFSNSG